MLSGNLSSGLALFLAARLTTADLKRAKIVTWANLQEVPD